MPPLTKDAFSKGLSRALGWSGEKESLETVLGRIPALDSLAHLPHGTAVWVRADLDVADRDGVIGDDPRLDSLKETLAFGKARGWRMVLLGHRGRKPDQTLEYVHQRLRTLHPSQAGPFIREWFDERATALTGTALKAIEGLPAGAYAVFENVRKYGFEMRAWKATPDDLPALSDAFERIAEAFRRGATAYVNDAIAASNKDFSSAALPLAMDHATLGGFSRRELGEHAVRAREAGLVSFSGLKLDKLDDLHGIVKRGRVELIVAGGNLAMALRKAEGESRGVDVSIGAAEDLSRSADKTHVPREAIERARALIDDAKAKGIRVLLPVDFVLEDGSVADDIPADRLQLDVGPKTRRIFDAEALAWAKATKRRAAFHNGVLGKFEDKTFAGGTEAMVGTLKRLQKAGISVYVGGGEGRNALERWGTLGDVTHAFTAGGTILKCLADRPLPFLEALAEHARVHGRPRA
jgi:phosphoglycerate kinase